MNEITAWMQSNWYSLGSLLAEVAFLVAGVWFARKTLKTILASQEQIGALLKLSLPDSVNEQSKANPAPHHATPYVMAEWPAGEAPALSIPEPEPRSHHLAAGWHGILHWLQTPMASGELTLHRRVLRWLQAPAGS